MEILQRTKNRLSVHHSDVVVRIKYFFPYAKFVQLRRKNRGAYQAKNRRGLGQYLLAVHRHRLGCSQHKN